MTQPYTPPVREKWIAQITFTDPGFSNAPPRTFTWEVFVDTNGSNREGEARYIACNNWNLGRQWPWLVSVYCAEELDNPLAHTRSTYGMVSA